MSIPGRRYPYRKLVSVRTSVKSTVFFDLARLLLPCTFSYTVYHKFHDVIFFSIFLMVSNS